MDWNSGKDNGMAVADLESFKGGFRFRRITAIAYVVISCLARIGKSELRISEIASAGFSGIIQQTLVLQLPGLLDLFCCPA